MAFIANPTPDDLLRVQEHQARQGRRILRDAAIIASIAVTVLTCGWVLVLTGHPWFGVPLVIGLCLVFRPGALLAMTVAHRLVFKRHPFDPNLPPERSFTVRRWPGLLGELLLVAVSLGVAVLSIALTR